MTPPQRQDKAAPQAQVTPANIKQTRMNAGFTSQRSLAREGVAQATLSRMEQIEPPPTAISNIFNVGRICSADPRDLVIPADVPAIDLAIGMADLNDDVLRHFSLVAHPTKATSSKVYAQVVDPETFSGLRRGQLRVLPFSPEVHDQRNFESVFATADKRRIWHVSDGIKIDAAFAAALEGQDLKLEGTGSFRRTGSLKDIAEQHIEGDRLRDNLKALLGDRFNLLHCDLDLLIPVRGTVMGEPETIWVQALWPLYVIAPASTFLMHISYLHCPGIPVKTADEWITYCRKMDDNASINGTHAGFLTELQKVFMQFSSNTIVNIDGTTTQLEAKD